MPSELNGNVASAPRVARTIATSSPNTTPRGTSKRTRMSVLSNAYGAKAVTCVVAYPRPNGRGSGVGGDVDSEASAAAVDAANANAQAQKRPAIIIRRTVLAFLAVDPPKRRDRGADAAKCGRWLSYDRS